MKKILFAVLAVSFLPLSASATTIYLTSGTSWTVPSDWNSSANTIEAIGGGGGGGYDKGGGGGGGEYRKVANVSFTAGALIPYAIGAAGAGGSSGVPHGGAGGVTSFNTSTLVANGGTGGVGGGTGTRAAGSGGTGGTGAAANSNGGNGSSGSSTTGGGAGGGAGGPNGAGVNASVGVSGHGGAGGAGDNGSGGAGGAAGGTGSGGSGGAGTEYDASHGSGGGGGGANSSTGVGGAGGLYGAGGGGGAGNTSGGSGTQGLIVITYTPSVSASAPTVITGSASSITTGSATLGGSISATGGADATQSGIAYSTDPALASGVSTSTLGAQTGTASFSSAVSSLSSGTVYYYRAYATNSGGTGYGTILSFTTTSSGGSITITTGSATSITASSATMPASYSMNNFSGTANLGIVYGTDPTLATGASSSTINTINTSGSGGSGGYSRAVTGLSSGTTYYYRGYSTDANGVVESYGSILSFTTTASSGPCGFGTYNSGTGKCVGYLTSGTSWTVPSDWNSSANTIEAIGGGGAGAGGGTQNLAYQYFGGGGGGGGGYSKAVNVALTTGASVNYAVGAGGNVGDTSQSGTTGYPWGVSGPAGGDTYLCNSTSNCASLSGSAVVAGAQGGQGSPATLSGSVEPGGAGGAASAGKGSVKYSGGTGGSGDSAGDGGGGAGAAGLNGAGVSGSGENGGAGDNGSGGAGAIGNSGGNINTAGNGTEWSASPAYGSGGGGPGGSDWGQSGGPGGSYGAGGGGGGFDQNYNAYAGGNGYQGIIVITYTPGSVACDVMLAQNPIAYGSSTTLSWGSTDATTMYINNVGYVTPNASSSTSVAPLSTTDYTCTAGTGTATSTQAASLTVSPPPAPTATIAASSTSIQVGQSTNLFATFAAGSGDVLTADNIDSPEGTGLGATTNPDASKTITFTPSSAGTYVFYARITTQYFTAWASYASTTVTVTAAPPTGTVSVTPSSIQQGSSATVTWSSSNATSCTGTNFSTGTATSGSVTVTPSQTTTYSVSCTGPGGTATLDNTSGTLSVSCTPSYGCSGNTIMYTDATCNTAPYPPAAPSCASPSFCSPGSSSCLYPPPSFVQNGIFTGHLFVAPSIVPQDSTTSLYWDITNVSTCTVSGTDGESWTGSAAGCAGSTCAAPSGGQITTPITQQTTFSLACTGSDGSLINESQIVNIVPVFRER